MTHTTRSGLGIEPRQAAILQPSANRHDNHADKPWCAHVAVTRIGAKLHFFAFL